jgi:hypothetical protein
MASSSCSLTKKLPFKYHNVGNGKYKHISQCGFSVYHKMASSVLAALLKGEKLSCLIASGNISGISESPFKFAFQFSYIFL